MRHDKRPHGASRIAMGAWVGCVAVTVAPAVTAQGVRPSPATSADPLKDGFERPPAAARPRVWWHWMNGNVTREGVARDLAWMKRVGIGGMTMFDGNLDTPRLVDKPAIFMTPEWKGHLRFAAAEAARLGLELMVSSSDGWSLTGGPSVTPAQAMKKLVWSATPLKGGQRFVGKLPLPPTVSGPFQDYPFLDYFTNAVSKKPPVAPFYTDARVIAYRVPAAVDAAGAKPFVTASGAARIDAARWTDGAFAQGQQVTASSDGLAWVRFDYRRPVIIRALTLGVDGVIPKGRVEVSDDGQAFRPLQAIDDLPSGNVFGNLPARTISIASPVAARFYRVVLEPRQTDGVEQQKGPATYRISELALEAEARVNRFEGKAAFDSLQDYHAAATPTLNPGTAIDAAAVVDLTRRMRPDGTLDWDAPAGQWVVLRMGSSLNGHRNSPATPEGTGLEVDKLDAGAVGAYLKSYFDPILAAVAPYTGERGLQAILTDSYEAGQQNWTPGLLAAFAERRGYDPAPWLPVLTGRVVSSAADSDKFLADYRQTLVDLFAEAHYKTIADFAHANGLKYYAESMGGSLAFAGNGLRNRSFSDIPMAEFWADGRFPHTQGDIRGAASIAHVYGQNLVAAESLTFATMPGHLPFASIPAEMKPQLDAKLALGVNRVVIHTSAHQPIEKAPGLTLGDYGQYFSRHEAWGEQAGAWMTYIARSSFMLQQGQAVRDVLTMLREGVGVVPTPVVPTVPAGYESDFIDATGLVGLLRVRDRELLTPSGMTYRVLTLPQGERRFSMPVMRKLRDLVRAGATLVGPKPIGAPGLGASDGDIMAIADELWGGGDRPRRVGKGMVDPGIVADALDRARVLPDVVAPGTPLAFYHRRTADADIYFVANGTDQAVTTKTTFRVSGRDVQLWRADTGTTEPASYRFDRERTTVPLRLSPGEAMFVVFRGKAAGPTRSVAAPVQTVLGTFDTGWTVDFARGWGAPPQVALSKLASWTESPDRGVRYFSGTGTYRRTISVPPGWLGGGGKLFLDLGKVGEIATVTVNGALAGTAWKAPFRVDVTTLLKPGRNELSISVANTWVNRIVGDKQPGARAYTFTTASTEPITPRTPLRPSGLLEPVRLIAVR